jgi:short-subunit dehydrogenase
MPDANRTDRALQVNVLAFERFARWALTSCTCFAATASIAGIRGLEDTNGYSASKAYMINAMEGYRRKSRHEKGRCHYITLLPGFVDTAMGQASRFWRCSTKEAAFVIIKGLERRQSVIYVTRRWALIAFLLRHLLPRWLFERIKLHI